MPDVPRALNPARLTPIAAALLALSAPAFAAIPADHRHDPAHDDETVETLDAVEVTATPLGGGADDLVRPVEVLAGTELDERRAATLGDTVDRLPGVQSSFFGVGVGRPVIRGQDGARVQVLSGGTSALDASTVSVDHAVTIEPFLADQIEVLKGPATLLYGSGAIGGAVNVVDGRIPTAPAGRAVAGRAELRYDTGTDGQVAAARVDADAGRLTIHADAFRREAGDVAIPGTAFSPSLVAEEIAERESPDHFARGRLPNSALTTLGGAIGASVFGERGWLGASASTYRSDYGIPPGAHVHEEHDEDGDGHEHGHDDEAAESVRIDLRQDRFETRGGWRGPGPVAELAWRLTRSRYEHTEFEGDAVGTVFANDGTELRVEAVQREVGGWNGAVGVQASERDFAAIGDEAFVPPSLTRDVGVFALQRRDFDVLRVEVGARHDRIDIDPAGALPTAGFGATSLSAGLRWHAADGVDVLLNLDRAQRAPTAEELHSDGPHVATQSFEVGDRELDVETALGGELGVHVARGRFDARASVYRTRFDDFIHLAGTGEALDGLPVRRWVQADATFTGWEAEAMFELADGASGAWHLRGFADGVDATLDAGGRLPRIAPGRTGLELDWTRGAWHAHAGVVRTAAQHDVAAGESATGGHTLVDAGVTWRQEREVATLEVFAEGRNLTDRDARVHTSFLKDVAPLPGRSVAVGVRVAF